MATCVCLQLAQQGITLLTTEGGLLAVLYRA